MDLFSNLPAPKAKAGTGNAAFLADLAEGVPDAVMRERFKRGEYPDLHRASVKGWRTLAGRKEGD